MTTPTTATLTTPTTTLIRVTCPACDHPIHCCSVAAVFAASEDHALWHDCNPDLPPLAGGHVNVQRPGETDAD